MHSKAILLSAIIALLFVAVMAGTGNRDREPEPEPVARTEAPDDKETGGSEPEVVAVEWGNQAREYRISSTILFSDPDADILFNFNMTGKGRASELQSWYPEIDVSDETGRTVLFSRADNDNDYVGQIRLTLHNAPKSNLRIRLKGADGWADIVRTLQYTKPFTVELESDDPVFRIIAEAVRKGAAGLSWHVPDGSETRLSVRFSTPPDREQVEQKFAQMFQEQQWSAEWVTDTEIRLTFSLRMDRAPYQVEFNLNGIANNEGYILDGAPGWSIYPGPLAVYGWTDLRTGEETELFRSSFAYEKAFPNPAGSSVIVQLHDSDESGASLFVLLDALNGGSPSRLFDPYELEKPAWLPDGQSFLYESGRGSEAAGIYRYYPEEDRSEKVWSPSRGKSADKIYNWRQPVVAPSGNRIFILDYRALSGEYTFPYSADLYILEGPEDRKPEVIKDFQQGYCEGATCYGYFHVLSDRLLISHTMKVSNDPQKRRSEFFMYDLDTGKRQVLRLEGDSFAVIHEKYALEFKEERETDQILGTKVDLVDLENGNRESLAVRADMQAYGISGPAVSIGQDRYLVPFYSGKSVILNMYEKTLSDYPYEYLGHFGDRIYWRKRLGE